MTRFALACLLVLACAGVSAHTLSVSHVELRRDAGAKQVQLDIDLAVRDLALTFPLDADCGARLSRSAATTMAPTSLSDMPPRAHRRAISRSITACSSIAIRSTAHW